MLHASKIEFNPASSQKKKACYPQGITSLSRYKIIISMFLLSQFPISSYAAVPLSL
jgi:hypothetical protein